MHQGGADAFGHCVAVRVWLRGEGNVRHKRGDVYALSKEFVPKDA